MNTLSHLKKVAIGNYAITIGSKTTTGGVISDNSGVIVNNQPIALVGDIANCTCGSKSCRGKGPIIETSPRNIILNGVSFAKIKDYVDTSCENCYLAESPNDVILGASATTPVNMGNGVSIGNGVSFVNLGIIIS
ncbi:PAAR domain-containing protein [Vibrio sp. F74]|uniref:PAAR domain-containing protein n=1 Tax=Vibrio sp. F74 TaxID=700020 RepID=UPI0035F57565